MYKQYFDFDDSARAVRVRRFDTPQPWINYLSNGSFHAFVSQAGGGFAWWHSPVILRLTRYRQYNLPIDSPGFYVKLQLGTWYDADAACVNYLCRHAENPRLAEVPLVFLASDRQVASYSGSRNDFVGDYRGERNPLDVENGVCGNATIECGEPALALHHRLTLEPGKPERINHFLGVAPGALMDTAAAEAERGRMLRELRVPATLERQERRLDAWWGEQFAAYQCRVPNAAAERQINTWNVVNSVQTGRYSRSVNTAAPGIRGIGFRGTCQDMLAIAYRRPEWAAETFLFLLSQQYRGGHTVHYAFPEERKPPLVSIRSDNHLWLSLLAYAIAAETGEFSHLERAVPFLAEDHQSKDGEGSVWEHLMAAMRFTENNLGAHRLPLTFASDWNDIIGRFNKTGRGETVFAAMQYALCLRHLLELAGGAGRDSDAEWLASCLDRQVAALGACAWDGGWWRRGFDDDGNPVGSAANDCGKLFLNPHKGGNVETPWMPRPPLT